MRSVACALLPAESLEMYACRRDAGHTHGTDGIGHPLVGSAQVDVVTGDAGHPPPQVLTVVSGGNPGTGRAAWAEQISDPHPAGRLRPSQFLAEDHVGGA